MTRKVQVGMTVDERRELCGGGVTLDGKPAAIGGARNDFAGVQALDGSASGEWAWSAVERIRSNGGEFRT